MKRAAALLLLTLLSPASALADARGLTAVPLLDTITTGDGKPLKYPEGQAKVSALLVELAPDGETGLHRHPMPVVGYIVSGEVTVSAQGMPDRVFKAGDAFVETIAWHNGRNLGKEPVKILAIYLGADGQMRVEKQKDSDGHY
ncbi:cupin domain-containing protein [Niveispirillum sp.]|uniref:cupin domain-containing protein n=1 Tax=Niveispirillum sp. TaxID=1917217 RepID=UPI001B41D163|nr:cupin domain-containing protein [Niveispirillum sp.]MBP7336321.1 cupin domain-containing protein [Niveispirillum sp.]